MGQAARFQVRASMRRFPLFGELDTAQLDFLCEGARFLETTRGDILCDSRTAPDVVSAGLVGTLRRRLAPNHNPAEVAFADGDPKAVLADPGRRCWHTDPFRGSTKPDPERAGLDLDKTTRANRGCCLEVEAPNVWRDRVERLTGRTNELESRPLQWRLCRDEDLPGAGPGVW